MDNCHECINVVQKLNEEFDTLQDENIRLEKKIEDLEHPRFCCEIEALWNNRWDEFLQNLDRKFNENSIWIHWDISLRGELHVRHNFEGIWGYIYPILIEELKELTDNKNKKWRIDFANIICVSIESILDCRYITHDIFTKKNLMKMIFNTIQVVWQRQRHGQYYLN